MPEYQSPMSALYATHSSQKHQDLSLQIVFINKLSYSPSNVRKDKSEQERYQSKYLGKTSRFNNITQLPKIEQRNQ